MVFRDGFEDFRVDLTAEERNSSADVLRDDRSLFSIFISVSIFRVFSLLLLKKWGKRWWWGHKTF